MINAAFNACADALIKVTKERHCDLRCAQDLIDPGVLTRAFHEFAERPGTINGYPNGHGSGRRAIDHEAFIKAVAEYRDSKQPRAAA